VRTTIVAMIAITLGAGFDTVSAQALSARAADPADVATLDGIISAFYDVVSGPAGAPRDWARDSTLYTATVRFAFPAGAGAERRWQTVDHAVYARQADTFLQQGFFEREIHRVVSRFGAMAHVFSTYEWSSPTPDGPQRGRGINSIELMFEDGRWWITYAQWAAESADQPIPAAYLPPG
jgi:hypothetical protein